MLPWIKAPTLAILRWFEGAKFTQESPCPEVLALTAYRAIIAAGETARWGRRNFAMHCGLSDFKARRIMIEADSSVEPPTTGIQTPTTDLPPASKLLPRGSKDQPSRSDETAISEESISHPPTTGIQTPTTDLPPASKRIPSRARVLDQRLEIRSGEEKEEEIRSNQNPQPPLQGDSTHKQFIGDGVPDQSLGLSNASKGKNSEMLIPDFISSHPAADAWAEVYHALKPAERDRIPLAIEVRDAFRLRNPSARAAAMTLAVYRAFRNLMRPYSAQDALKICLDAIDGAHRDSWTTSRGKAAEWGWIFRDANLEKFARFAVEGPPQGQSGSKLNAVGAVQRGYTEADVADIFPKRKGI